MSLKLLGLRITLIALCECVRLVSGESMFLPLVHPQGCNRWECEITTRLRTGNMELSGGATLCWRVIAFFRSFRFLFLFNLLVINHPPLSCILGFTASFLALWFSITVYFICKFLLVLQELLFRLETLTTFAALKGVDVVGHGGALGVHCDAMVAKS